MYCVDIAEDLELEYELALLADSEPDPPELEYARFLALAAQAPRTAAAVDDGRLYPWEAGPARPALKWPGGLRCMRVDRLLDLHRVIDARARMESTARILRRLAAVEVQILLMLPAAAAEADMRTSREAPLATTGAGRAIPTPALTPRVLAQRPQVARARAGCF